MTGAQWANQDQIEFLWSFISEYYKINKGDKNYVPFWSRLKEKWFELYPEHKVCFPDKELDDLLPDEVACVTESIQARIKQLKTWFRWRVNPRATTGGRRGRLADLELLEECTRQLKDYEMYSKLYYDEKIKPLVEEVEEELGSMELSKGEKLNLRKRIAKDLYEGEDEDVKELVIAKLKERAKVMEDKKSEVDRTPLQYLRSIKDAPGILGRCLDGLHAGSGWSYLVVMGGPHPLSNGDISVASYNVGPEGADFSQSYPDIQKTYMARFTEYLEKIYPEATRLERALTQPLETDDLDDLSLEPDNIVPEERSIPQPSATSAPKKKQSAKRKSPSKTTEAVQRTSTTSSKASATVSNASTVVPTTSILTHVPGPGVSNTTANLTTTNATTSSDDSAMVPNASTIVPTASIVTHITDPGATNTTNNTITTNAEATSISWEQFAATCAFPFPGDHSNPSLENSMPLNEFNEDSNMMGMGSDDHSCALDMDPQFPTFSSELDFISTAFGLQNEQSLQSSSTSADGGFNLHISPTFNSSNLSFDTPSAFGFEQISCPSSVSTDFTSIVSNNNLSFSVPAAPINASQPSQFMDASSFMQFQPTPAPAPAFPHTGASPPTIAPALVNASSSTSNASSPIVVPSNAPQHIPATSNASLQPTITPVSVSISTRPAALSNASSPTVVPSNAPQHIPAVSYASLQPTITPVSVSISTRPAVAPSDASSPRTPPPAQNVAKVQHAAAVGQPGVV